MVGHSVDEYTFSQKNQVKTLASAVHIKTGSGDRFEIDPVQLCQRLLLIGVEDVPLPVFLEYELCAFPASLFENSLRIRSGDNAE